jgi:hypothetical protein
MVVIRGVEEAHQGNVVVVVDPVMQDELDSQVK